MRKTVYIGRNTYYICGVWEVGQQGREQGWRTGWGIVNVAVRGGHLWPFIGGGNEPWPFIDGGCELS